MPRSVCDDDAAQLKDTYGSWAECAAFSVEELEAGFCAEIGSLPLFIQGVAVFYCVLVSVWCFFQNIVPLLC